MNNYERAAMTGRTLFCSGAASVLGARWGASAGKGPGGGHPMSGLGAVIEAAVLTETRPAETGVVVRRG